MTGHPSKADDATSALAVYRTPSCALAVATLRTFTYTATCRTASSRTTISVETSTKSTTALPRSPSSWGGPSAGARREPASGGGQRRPSSATARDGVQRVGDRADDDLAERDQDGQH